MTYSGKCLCGTITYQASGSPIVVGQCHCEQCRRLSGTGHAIGAMFPVSAVTFNGALSEYKYKSAKGSEVTKAFCGAGGSPIYGTNSQNSDYLTLTLGSMDDAEDLQVEVVIFERDKQHWDHLPAEAVCFETQPDWKPSGTEG
jgi:hypothetical protein